MPAQRGQRRPRGAFRNRGNQRKRIREETRAGFTSSRTQEDLDNGAENDENFSDLDIPDGVEEPTSEDDDTPPTQFYASLLRVLKPHQDETQRPTKRRKLENDTTIPEVTSRAAVDDVEEQKDEAVPGQLEDEVDDDLDEHDDADSDDEDFLLHDPFEQHYVKITEGHLSASIQHQDKPIHEKSTIGQGIRKSSTFYHWKPRKTAAKHTAKDYKLKKRLTEPGLPALAGLVQHEQDLANEVFEYRDILAGLRSLENAPKLRDITCLHAMNHVFKTRDRVLKNNAKLAQESNGDAEYRDQGFTRPKVLILLPTKEACVRYVESIVKLSQPDQQENKGRFVNHFSRPEGESFEYKPDDFREVFGGNHEEDFRMGLKFTRKTIKFFSGFYNSDIIFASPLGLMRTITTGGGKKEDKKSYDADFLSSIEITILDNATAMGMQNWQHVDYVFSQLNLLPRDSHGCDFARARSWYLDGKAKYLRQTIVFASYLTPAISSLASTHLHNIAGRAKYTPIYPGAMLYQPLSLPIRLPQRFLRFDSPTPQADSDNRFKFFAATILPSLLQSSHKSQPQKGTLLFVPSYLDFVRLRNHFSTATETTSLSFGTISEYSPVRDVARSRSHFLAGRHSILLYSERAHHYFRYKLKGIRRVIFYGVPENPLFWGEMLEFMAANAATDVEWALGLRKQKTGKEAKGLVRALFSRWDIMKLERIVGTERVGRLVRDGEGDVFEFV